MATISNTPRPGYVWDSTDNVWYPIGVGGHSHSEIASTIADAKGDLIAGTAADTVARLAVGTNNHTLIADSAEATGLKYAAGSKATLTTTGDILYASAANTPARLGIGSASQVLTVASGIPSWATPATASSGLTLISRATVTNAATTSTTFDGVFSNTYNAYQIIIESAFAVSGSCALKFNWRNSGSSLSSAEYYGVTNLMDLSSTNTSVGQIGTTFMTLIAQTGGSLAASAGLNLTAKMVRTTQTPTIFGVVTGNNASGTGVCGTKYNAATNADGFILSVSTGNITCTVAVYGLAAA